MDYLHPSRPTPQHVVNRALMGFVAAVKLDVNSEVRSRIQSDLDALRESPPITEAESRIQTLERRKMEAKGHQFKLERALELAKAEHSEALGKGTDDQVATTREAVRVKAGELESVQEEVETLTRFREDASRESISVERRETKKLESELLTKYTAEHAAKFDALIELFEQPEFLQLLTDISACTEIHHRLMTGRFAV